LSISIDSDGSCAWSSKSVFRDGEMKQVESGTRERVAMIRNVRPVFMLCLTLLLCPLPAKSDSCPSGWQVIAGQCVPISGQSSQLVPKIGACPSGWHASGGYCVVTSEKSKAIVPKVGACPGGWHPAGNYCVANSEEEKPIVPKQGACPSGWRASGAWCQQN
jgi:uncharacterized protein YbdZ (MbtH family)